MVNNMIEEGEEKKYEVGFLIKSEPDKEGLIKILKDNQFSIINAGQTSRIKLAYSIKKENFAYFGYLHFSGDPANVPKLSDQIKNDSKVLRFLIIPQSIIKEGEGRIPEEISSTRAKYFSERQKVQGTPFESPAPQLPKKPARTEALSNEALEKKLEEILK
jgi:ribosomal protein S6